jgi:histidinol-phosphate aminotransferase
VPLLEAYGSYTGLAREHLLCTRGADEGIELLVRAFCTPGSDRIVTTPPTYGMYQVSAAVHGVEVVEVPRGQDFSLDVRAIEAAADVKLIFICSPNNPTGTLSSREEVAQLLESVSERALIVIDEAYIEFCFAESQQQLLSRFPHLVILRTLSKAFGLAAVRCGFVLAHPDVIAILSNIIAPYPVPSPVEQIARQALAADGIARMKNGVREINRTRDKLFHEIEGLAGVVRVTSSFSNFLLVEFADETRALASLREEKVVVRTPYTQGLISNSQRISIGTEEEMRRVLRALRRLGE